MPDFFEEPILNSPYTYPGQHWELDETGQPTGNVKSIRRKADFITPIPKPKRRGGRRETQRELELETESGFGRYDPTPIIGEVRRHVDTWRTSPQQNWRVTPETARLLDYWRNHDFQGLSLIHI